jgi:uncharacterized repeat protein (TIGR01451 family)
VNVAGFRFDTLVLIAADTAIVNGITLRLTATNGVGATNLPVVHNQTTDTIYVGKGADPKVWLDTVDHPVKYHVGYSYTIAATNLGQFYADTVWLHHAVPSLARLDSVLYRKGSTDTTWTAPGLPPRYFASTLQAFAADTARFTFYVTTEPTDSARHDTIAGSIACGNDYDVADSSNVFGLRDEEIIRNPYNIAVSIAALSDSVAGIDGTITYRIVVRNIGDSIAYNVVLTDSTPFDLDTAGNPKPMLQFKPDSTTYTYFYGIESSGTSYVEDASTLPDYLRFAIGTLPAGDSVIVFLNARKLSNAGPVVNRVTVGIDISNTYFPYPPGYLFDEEGDLYLSDNTDTTLVKVYSTANIELSIEPATTVVAQGDTVEFTIRAYNPSHEETLEHLHIVIPPDIYKNGIMCGGRLMLLSWTIDNGFTPSNGYWVVTIAPDSTVALTLRVIVLDSLPANPGELDSAKFIMSATPMPDINEYYIGINGIASSTVYINYTDFDVSVKNSVFVYRGTDNVTVADGPIYDYENFGYRIVVTSERGPADSVSLELVLPAGLTASDVERSYPTPSDMSGGIIRWDNLASHYGQLVKNESREVVVIFKQQPIGSYTAIAKVGTGGRKEASLVNNIDSATAKVVSPYSASIAIAGNSDLLSGDETDLTITITNLSAFGLSDITLRTEALPQWLNFVGSTDGVALNDLGELTWQYPGSPLLQPNETITLTIKLRAAATSNETGTWTISAYLQNETILADTKTLLVVVKENPLKVEVKISPSVFYTSDITKHPDTTFIYTIKVSNTSLASDTFRNVMVTVTLPDGIMTVGSLQHIVIDTVSRLLNGHDTTIVDTCKFVGGTAAAGLYVHSVSATVAEYNSRSLAADDSDTLDLRNDVNLVTALELRSMSGNVYPPSHEFRQGETVVAYLRLENNGRIYPNGTDSVHVEYVVPSQFVFVSGDTIAALDSVYLPAVAPDSLKEYFDTLRVEQVGSGAFTFSVKASTAYNGAPVLDTASVSGTVVPGADIQVEIIAPAPAHDYDLLRIYTVRVVNLGTWPADNLSLQHTVPSDLEIVSYDTTSITREEDNQLLVLESASLGVGEAMSFWVLVQLRTKPDGDRVEVLLDATATADADYRLGNNTVLQTLLFSPYPYNITLSVSPQDTILHNVEGVASELSAVAYNIVLRNSGSMPANNVRLSFSLSSQLSIDNGSQDTTLAQNVYLNMGGEHRATLFVRPLSNSSSGLQRTFTLASINDEVYRQEQLDTLRDTTRIALFSVLDSWNIMEAFSPNGDGKNDKFFLGDLRETGFVESADIVIVNRMGSEVYRHKNYKAAQEDESQAFTAKGLPEGTYFYRLTVNFNDGSPSATRGGFITVRRGRWE